MKKFILIPIFGLLSILAFSQQLFFEVYSGANRTIYEIEKYGTPSWYVPVGARLAGGHEHVQIGVEYNQNILDPTFTFADNEGNDIAKDVFELTYYGGFLRGNISKLPAYRFGIVFKAGAGYYNAKLNQFTLPDDKIVQEVTYDKTLGFNGGIGVSSPIYAQLHWEIGYQFNYVSRPAIANLSIPEYNAFYHSIQIGLSLNFVFGNTEKRCRRSMSSHRRGGLKW